MDATADGGCDKIGGGGGGSTGGEQCQSGNGVCCVFYHRVLFYEAKLVKSGKLVVSSMEIVRK